MTSLPLPNLIDEKISDVESDEYNKNLASLNRRKSILMSELLKTDSEINKLKLDYVEVIPLSQVNSLKLPNLFDEEVRHVTEKVGHTDSNEYIPSVRPLSRINSRTISELLRTESEEEIDVVDKMFKKHYSEHDDCEDDSKCVLVYHAPDSTPFAYFRCAHCKHIGGFPSKRKTDDKLKPPYQCLLCKCYMHHDCYKIINKVHDDNCFSYLRLLFDCI